MVDGPLDMLSYWEKAKVWATLAWSWISAHAHVHVRRRCVTHQEWTIQAAYAFDDETGNFQDITAWFRPETWEEDVAFLEWKEPRIDVRYTRCSPFGKVSKYRMVLRPGKACLFPPPPQPSNGVRGIISATLEPFAHIEGAKSVDVTTRLTKYAGPYKDFHSGQGLSIRPLDCFPFDDPEALSQRFETLTIMDASNLVSQDIHEFKLAENKDIQIA